MGFRDFFQKGKPPVQEVQEEIMEEEIKSIVNEGHEQGIFNENEAKMIKNIFSLDDKDAHDIMIHRKNIEAVDEEMTIREFLYFVENKGYSRYPVYKQDLDNIVGVLHIKDILGLMLKQDYLDQKICEIPNLVLPAAFIPETRNIDVLFQRMQTIKTHMVIVVDEYGQTAGLVTMEDILEEIVGNIFDEHDKEEQYIIPQKDGSYIIDGLCDLDEVFNVLHITDEECQEEFDTLNGYLISKIDKIPSDGERFAIEDHGYVFNVLVVEHKMIRSIKVSSISCKLPDKMVE